MALRRPRGQSYGHAQAQLENTVWENLPSWGDSQCMVTRNQGMHALALQLLARQFRETSNSHLRSSLWNRAPSLTRANLMTYPYIDFSSPLSHPSLFPYLLLRITFQINYLYPSHSLRLCFPGIRDYDILLHVVPSHQLSLQCTLNTYTLWKNIYGESPVFRHHGEGRKSLSHGAYSGTYRRYFNASIYERTR